jgi:hypothetical protein
MERLFRTSPSSWRLVRDRNNFTTCSAIFQLTFLTKKFHFVKQNLYIRQQLYLNYYVVVAKVTILFLGIIILINFFLAVALTGEAFIAEKRDGLLDRYGKN